MEEHNNEQPHKEFEEKAGPFEFRFEGLKDGYRVTVKGNESKIRRNRHVRNSFMKFLSDAEESGVWLPRPLRWVLMIWRRYNGRV